MDIIIAGLGAVGSAIMEELSKQGHNIVVIDTVSSKVEDAVNGYDVKGVIGNCASSEVLKEAGVSSAELMIAATSQDELNILSCIIANKLGAKKTIARASKPEYLELFKNEGDLGLSLMVNPQHEAALEIVNILRFPSAIKVNKFSEGKVELVEFLVPDDSPLNGLQLKDLPKRFKAKVLICAVNRNTKPIIPTGDFIIHPDDRLFLTSNTRDISKFFRELGWNRQARNIMIVGGGRTAYYLCQQLDKLGIHAKLIERNPKTCKRFSETFAKTEIILGDGTDQELLTDEGIGEVDAFVALGSIDEQNIIMSMYANSVGVPKVITKLDQISYYKMLQHNGIYSAVSTKTSTAYQIIRFVRHLEHKESNSVRRVFHIIEDSTEILEFEATEQFGKLNVPIKDLDLKKNLLVAGIIRNGEFIAPSGQDQIELGDNVIIATLEEGLFKLDDILA